MTDWVTDLVEQMGYLGIIFLMFLENLFPPIPSEVIMPLAGFGAADGKYHIALVILAGLAGTMLGALFWYAVARKIGDERLRRWADRHGRSIPAGVFAMPLPRFLFLTAIGAGIWTGALAVAGYLLGERFEGVEKYMGPVSTAIIGALVVVYIWRVIRFKPERA